MKKRKKIKTTKAEKQKAQRIFASMGGQALAKKRGSAGMSKLGKEGAKARWGKKQK